MKRHGRVLASAPTAAAMRLRGATRCDFQVAAWGERVPVGAAQVSLHPAGHVLGSAQVLVEWNEARVLYSGDFKLRPGLSCETTVVPQCDVLVMETTFGLPRYKFPDSAQVVADIRAWCRATLERGRTPVLLCYSLGKGQEVLAGLLGADFPIYLAPTHWKMSELYRGFGVQLPSYHRFEADAWAGKTLDGVLLCAPQCRRARWWGEMRGLTTAYISGWALDEGACWRFGTDAAFPLSDHADYADLWNYVVQSGARRVYTLHGFARPFAADLRAAGWSACALEDVDMGAAIAHIPHELAKCERVARSVGGDARAESVPAPITSQVSAPRGRRSLSRAQRAEVAGQMCLF